MLGILIIIMVMVIVSYFLAKTAPLLIKKAWVGVKKDKLNLFAYIKRLLLTVYYLLSDFYVLYYIIYGVSAIIGTTITPFFFAFHLFDVIVRFPELKFVIMSVWIPKKSIGLIFGLFLTLLYVFSLISYFFFDWAY